ncbi:MAG: glycosyltransferase [Alphaproteobacteria bacterium]|nr:glycosyltransferase [Alphaproteobacteria bacterium]MBU2378742.1 glycosyltransferase [Alphaproteobacteria bacterium]
MKTAPAPAHRKILYVGELLAGSTSLQRCEGLERLGCQVERIATRRPNWRFGPMSRISYAAYRSGLPAPTPDPMAVNEQIRSAMVRDKPDQLWLDKALSVRRATLRTARRLAPDLRIVGYSPDDMGQRHNRSRAFDSHVRDYDVFFTTKSYGVEDLSRLGCVRPVFVANAYDPKIHRPLVPSVGEREAFGADISFIGTYEPDRHRAIAALAAAGLPVRVWGSGWERAPPLDGVRIEGRALYGDDYARVLCASRINLCFLRKLNRDLQTTRSVEIPACGAFMLAERTSEHLSLFKEGAEAAFFQDDDELVDQCRWYLNHEVDRRAVALAGRARCLSSGYSNDERLDEMLAVVARLPADR